MAAVDTAMLAFVADFIRQGSAGGHCGTWALSTDLAMNFLGAVSLPVAIGLLWTYQDHRETLRPAFRLVVRLPLCCLSALLLTYFAVFPAVIL